MGFIDELQAVTWTSPKGDVFTLKTLESGYTQKHIGEVKENPRTSYSASTSTKRGGGKKSKTSSSSSVSTSNSKKRVADVNDTFTDLGVGGRDITLDCYFIGENHHTKAKAFEKALCQTGKSKLQLAFGDEFTVNVITFKVSNTLAQNINTTIINVNWHETAKTTYPQSQKSKTKEIKNAAAVAKDNVAADFAEVVENITTPTRMQAFNTNFSNVLNKATGALDFANNLTLKTIMNDIMGQNLQTSALTMATQLGIVFYKAAALAQRVKNPTSFFRLASGYGSLYGGWRSLISTLITNSSTPNTKTSLTKNEIDNLLINDTTASLAIISIAESAIETQYETRAEAVDAAKNLIELEQTWTNFVEDETEKITELENVFIRDDGLQSVVAGAANEILERSYKLKIEKTIVLDEDKTILELAYEYYTNDFYVNPDSTVDYLIATNGFKDNQFFMLPRGSEVRIYV